MLKIICISDNIFQSPFIEIFFLNIDKKEAIWIALVGLFVHVDIKYWDFLTLEGTFITPTFCFQVMKVPSVSLISPYIMFFSRFCHFLSLFLTFSNFSNFHDPRYMKPCKNQRFQFSLIFMTPGNAWTVKIGERSGPL